MSLLSKISHAVRHPPYVWARIRGAVERQTQYDYRQWSRIVMYRELFDQVRHMGPEKFSVLEIAPGGVTSPWRNLRFGEYYHVDHPNFDICQDRLDRTFDLVIADQVFEHLLWPYRAAKNAHAMVKPGGRFINTTPFLIKVHLNPVDCSRWTETGMKYFLAEAGFPLDKISTGSWGNLKCVDANLRGKRWASYGWGRSLLNEPEFPVAVWAIAEK